MLEHLSRDQARFVLRECHRVLRPGGSLRLVVPDLEVLVRAYLADDRTILPATEPTAADALVEGLGLRPSPSRNHLVRVAQRALRSDVGGHHWMYDGTSLAHLVREAGFVDATRVDFRQGRDSEAAALDYRSAFHVHLEAFRPEG
jgi:predicted SAM-dependent methyltransferase